MPRAPNVLTSSAFRALIAEKDGEEFSLPGAGPFLFRPDANAHELTVLFGDGHEVTVLGSVQLRLDELSVSMRGWVPKPAEDRVRDAMPALAELCLECVRVRGERAAALREEVMNLMGPEDRRARTISVPTNSTLVSRLVRFADYFRAASPPSFRLTSITPLRNNTPVIGVSAIAARGVSMRVMRLKIMPGRVEAESLIPDERPREFLVRDIVEGMLARRERVLADPDISAAIADLRSRVAPEDLRKFPRLRDGTWSQAWGRAHYTCDEGAWAYPDRSDLMTGRDPLTEVIGVGSGFSIVALRKPSEDIVPVSIMLGDEVLTTSAGCLPGLSEGWELWASAMTLAARSDPDLFPEMGRVMSSGEKDIAARILEVLDEEAGASPTEGP